jgi:tetratricopeptide (TPR) repeat protein
MNPTLLRIWGAGSALALSLLASLWAAPALSDTSEAKLAAEPPAYVTSEVCAGCHEAEHEAWETSHHYWALRPPTEPWMLGDFNDATFEHLGVTTRFSTREGRYFVETEGADGETALFEVKYAVGVTPLQQYLIELDGGWLQTLSVSWDVEGQRWFHLYPDRRIVPDDGFHWTGVYQNWNARCAECHSTDYAKGYDVQSGTYASTWAEMNVGCEACHGPGEAHVAWARAPGSYDPTRFKDVGESGLAVATAQLDAGSEIELCADCHSRRQSLRPRSQPAGEPFVDDFVTALLRERLYYADGQILDEVYVYGSFLQSSMHARGVRCSDCHDVHQLDTRDKGNAICTGCHNPDGDARFATLKAGLFDAPSHHFHSQDSAGAQCVECHMPSRNYMVVDPRRDHSFRVPRPDLSVRLGTPNACTMCHAEKTDAWAAAQVKTWYPDGRSGTPHYAEALAAGRAGGADAADRLVALALNVDQPAIVRATALDLLRGFGPAAADATQALLADPAPLVRRSAAMLQAAAPMQRRIQRLAPLLRDSVRTVRIEAARQLVGAPLSAFPQGTVEALEPAFAEYQASLLATADMPETQMNLAALAYRMGNAPATEAALRTALSMDRHLDAAWLHLGELQHATGRGDEAEATLRESVQTLPESGELHYALGLLLAERGQSEAAAESLERAVSLLPDDPRARYNLSLMMDSLGRTEAAEILMREALWLSPDDPEMLYALGIHYLRRGRLEDATAQAERLIKLDPQSPEGRQLLRAIEDARQGR